VQSGGEAEAPAVSMGGVALLLLVGYNYYCHDVALAACPAVGIPGGETNILAGWDCYDAEHYEAFAEVARIS